MRNALVLLLVGCPAPGPTAPVEPPAASCTDRPCLEAHEGQLIELDGTFVAPVDPKRKGLHLHKLALADGTLIILDFDRDHPVRAKLSKSNDGKRVTIRGRIFTKEIPERYGIIESTAGPYLLDIVDATVR